jgi:hypothetical protein
MMKKIISLCLISMVYSISIFSNEIKILDFDISGVKLKMDPKTVIKKLKSTYNLRDEDIIVSRNLSWKKYNKNMNLSKIKAFRQAERGKSPNFHVGFCISEDNNKSEVSSVEYGIPDVKANMKKMYDMAIKKYGEPSFSSYSKTTHTWCDENKITHILGSSYKCTKDNPLISLNLRRTNISLYSDECMFNNRKIRENKKITSPKF